VLVAKRWNHFPPQVPLIPNLLATSKGRLLFFFLLYIGEGLPQGCTCTVVALEFNRMGMNVEAISALMIAVTAPWAWKWLAGPIVDNLHLARFGRRKQWIVGSQILMIVSLIAFRWHRLDRPLGLERCLHRHGPLLPACYRLHCDYLA